MSRARDQVYDELLVLRCGEGDEAAFAELAERWQGRLLAHAMQLTGRRDAAQDAVQETWLALIRSLHRIEDPARFPAYAHRILTRRCADHVRRQQRRREVMGIVGGELASPLPARSVDGPLTDQAVDARQLRDAIGALPEDGRILLALHYLYDLPLMDIATLLRIPRGTVKSRLHRTRNALRSLLEKRTNR